MLIWKLISPKGLKFKSTFGIDYANGVFYRFQPIFNDNGTINGSSSRNCHSYQ